MRLSTRARYALRMMAVLARHTNGDGLVSLARISEEATISRRYLEQLVIGLKHGDLIHGRSGKGGGYALSLPSEEIKIRQIIESVIGPINIVECVLHPETCQKADECKARCVYVLLNERITSLMDGLVLDDLVHTNCLEDMAMAVDTAVPAAPSKDAKQFCD